LSVFPVMGETGVPNFSRLIDGHQCKPAQG
jgi:hypothetical protein